MCHTLLDRLFVSLNHQFRMLRFFIWVINTGKVLEFSLVNKLVEILDVSLTTHLNRTLDIYLNKIADLFACPFASFTVGGDSGRNAYHTVAGQQAAYECNALDVGIAVFTTKTKLLAQMGAYDVAIEYLNPGTALPETQFNELS